MIEPPPLAFIAGHRVLAAEEHAFGHHGVLEAEFLERAALGRGDLHDAGVVHEDVQAAELLHGLGDDFLPACLVTHVLHEEECGTAGC